MSLKVKLFSCISAFIIVVSLMLISVFAATNVTLNIGGNVSFTANSVNALITGSIAGNAAGGSTLTSIDIDASDSDGAVSMPTDWTNMDLTFTESASPITVTINIQNRSTDRAIAVSLTDSTNISNVTVTRECDSAGINATDNRNIPGGETATYTFELSVQSQNTSASGAFSLAVGLENAGSTNQGYTVTIDFDPTVESDITVAINDMQSFVHPSYIDGVEYTQDESAVGGVIPFECTLKNVTKIAFGGSYSQVTRAVLQYTMIVTSDSGINTSGEFGVSSDTSFLGWYDITEDTTFYITTLYQ